MKVVSMGFPKTMFPYRSVSQRLNLEYDEIDEVMDQLFAEILENESVERSAPHQQSAENAA
jgi:hypothetical protein